MKNNILFAGLTCLATYFALQLFEADKLPWFNVLCAIVLINASVYFAQELTIFKKEKINLDDVIKQNIAAHAKNNMPSIINSAPTYSKPPPPGNPPSINQESDTDKQRRLLAFITFCDENKLDDEQIRRLTIFLLKNNVQIVA